MIALDFNDTIANGAAGAALYLQSLRELGEIPTSQGNTCHQGHALSLAPFGLAGDPNDAIALLSNFYNRANTLGIRPPRGGAFIEVAVGGLFGHDGKGVAAALML